MSQPKYFVGVDGGTEGVNASHIAWGSKRATINSYLVHITDKKPALHLEWLSHSAIPNAVPSPWLFGIEIDLN
eukprot:scaffold658913_cov59-Prasinocladus_malaysianus.AAC.1